MLWKMLPDFKYGGDVYLLCALVFGDDFDIGATSDSGDMATLA